MQNHLHFDCLNSTNVYLKQLIDVSSQPLASFFTITADRQEQGRGRQSKTWESEDSKNLLMSVLLYPDYPPDKQFYICRFVSLSLVDFLTKQANIQNVYIKYPNDIYVKNKKIAGILIEHSLQGNKINYSIAGIGLNVNQAVFSENVPNPTSIFLETQREVPPLFCMEEIVKKLQVFSLYNATVLENKYMQFLYKKSEYAVFLIPKISDYPIEAKINGVSENGLLLLSDKENKSFACALNEIIYL